MTWTQVYDPLGHWWLPILVAALPIIVLFGLLAGLRVKPHWCAEAGAATVVLVAMSVFHMPVQLATISAGGVMGKMVDAQSITIATSATNQVGNEGIIFRFVVWHSVALGAIVGVIVMLYAYVFPQFVPHGLHFLK